ncbi:tail completion or Neck1 protein [Pseudomonas phage Knedl]|nr:tail completion or Neck1 protein [Pseudomonas phage Knedl]
MNLKQFAAKMKKTASDMEYNIVEIKREVAVVVLTELANTTPVDTGLAVSNWRVAINQPVAYLIAPHAPGKYQSTRPANVRATIAQGVQMLDTLIGEDVVHIGNNLSYITDLDEGWSPQAPEGMTKNAIAKGIEAMHKVKLIGGRYVRSN